MLALWPTDSMSVFSRRLFVRLGGPERRQKPI